jgi:hypothetical protein
MSVSSASVAPAAGIQAGAIKKARDSRQPFCTTTAANPGCPKVMYVQQQYETAPRRA